jgi:hypothetical protein
MLNFYYKWNFPLFKAMEKPIMYKTAAAVIITEPVNKELFKSVFLRSTVRDLMLSIGITVRTEITEFNVSDTE